MHAYKLSWDPMHRNHLRATATRMEDADMHLCRAGGETCADLKSEALEFSIPVHHSPDAFSACFAQPQTGPVELIAWSAECRWIS